MKYYSLTSTIVLSFQTIINHVLSYLKKSLNQLSVGSIGTYHKKEILNMLASLLIF